MPRPNNFVLFQLSADRLLITEILVTDYWILNADYWLLNAGC